ncbi:MULTISPECIES: LysR substrate-binding domain-containing protein [unclassified Massilia]|uniref:LysR substrate-binding domain-containing protein n=1 Tax=unclassified Massilia TaxID=2609279 RepID=UPI001B841CA5|nr:MULTISPECIES: LysR substrate-binding domain-containing protein [unclassified Massilia]MBQ5938407.1 LysR family transcriptional regulator [Massilia sp. AB1]MBQ5963285.1 LysR family transcriptional regulator [Massilia sp. ZL223]
MKPLRSLSGLIDFECAARWGSFKLAARELHKTPAAVSQQVKQLEENVGFPLFVRHPRHISLTEKGQELAIATGRMLGDLRAKVAALQRGDEESVLRISTTHSFAIKWLVPRMHRFTKLYPELDIRIDSNDAPVDLHADSTDVAIRYGPVREGDPSVLFRERLVPVYSPELLAPGQAGLTLADLPHCRLLVEQSPEAWLQLLNENKALKGKYDFSRGYSHWGVLVQAAVAGQGVALVPYGIAFQDIVKGALRQIPARSAPFANGYKFLVNPHKEHMLKVQRFRAWMVGEMEEMRASLEKG